MYRQGDVLVTPIPKEELPPDLVPAPRDRSGRLVLAYGEATGHAHVCRGTDVQLLCKSDDPDRMFLVIGGYGRLSHEEHGPIPLPAGQYRVIRQREYIPGAVRPVAD